MPDLAELCVNDHDTSGLGNTLFAIEVYWTKC